jgi:hypothetical protein
MLERRTDLHTPPMRKAPPPPPRRGRALKKDRLDFAKWPPDDDNLPAGPPAPAGGGSMGADDGNFKRGRFNPAAIVGGPPHRGGVAACTSACG